MTPIVYLPPNTETKVVTCEISEILSLKITNIKLLAIPPKDGNKKSPSPLQKNDHPLK